MKTPLTLIRENINNINYLCNEQNLKNIKETVKICLEKLDNYFNKNNVYNEIDFEPITSKILSKKFQIAINDEKYKNFVSDFNPGLFFNLVNDVCLIMLSEKFLDKGRLSQSIFAHEFIHFLKLGTRRKRVKENNRIYDIYLPEIKNGRIKDGFKFDTQTKKITYLKTDKILASHFFDEGYTELLTKTVFGEFESYLSYTPQTTIIKLLNDLSGKKEKNFVDFLKGEAQSQLNFWGEDILNQIAILCQDFQEEYEQNKGLGIDYLANEKYQKILDFICLTALEKIYSNPEEFSLKRMIDITSTILKVVRNPIYTNSNMQYDFYYKNEVDEVFKKYAENLFKDDHKNINNFINKLHQISNDVYLKDTKYFSIQTSHKNFEFKKTKSNKLAMSYKGCGFVVLDFSLKPYTKSANQNLSSRYSADFIQIDKHLWKITIKDNKDNTSEEIKLGYDIDKNLYYIDNNLSKEYLDFSANDKFLKNRIKNNFEEVEKLKETAQNKSFTDSKTQ